MDKIFSVYGGILGSNMLQVVGDALKCVSTN